MVMADETISGFLGALASRAATPGGGSASALIGAVGAALCGMVGRLNEKKRGEEPGPLHDTIEPADAAMARLMTLADEDIAAFTELMRTWKLAGDEPEAERQKQTATMAATEAPLAIMTAAMAVMRLAVQGLETSKKNCVSDAGVAAFAAKAALEGARLNVMINLPGISDEKRRAALRERADALLAEAQTLSETVRRRIEALYA
jgi:formiminotetrahydrofolate cyclodeaminase